MVGIQMGKEIENYEFDIIDHIFANKMAAYFLY